MSLKRPIVLLTAMLLWGLPLLRGQQAVGKWSDYLSYNNLRQVIAAGDRIYAVGAGGLFYYDLDDLTLNRLNKNTLLNDVGISTVAYDPQTHWLAVAYNNSNLDLMKEERVTNLSDIKRATIGGSKRINHITFNDRCAYLACGFGITVVDLARQEIKETYYLGDDGGYLNINDIAFTKDYIVAATDQGLCYAPKGSNLLHVASTWQRDNNSLLAGQHITQLTVAPDGNLLALCTDGDTIIYRESGSMSFAPWLNGSIRSIHQAEGRLLVCYENHVDIYDSDYQQRYSIGDVSWMTMSPNDATMTADGRLWVASTWAGLAMITPGNNEKLTTLCPPGPAGDNCFRVVTYNRDLLVCPGGYNTTFAKAYIPASIYTRKDYDWSQPSDPDGLLNGLSDIVDVAVNPRNAKQRMATAWGQGVVEISDGKVTHFYNESNSDGALTPYTQGNSSTLLVGSVAFDLQGNAWFTNGWSPYGLAVRRSNGSWQSFNTQSMIGGNMVNHILYDSIQDLKLMWGVSNKIYVHDGKEQMAYIDPNNGAQLETTIIGSVVQDRDGNLWIGTNKGIKVVYNLNNVFGNGGNGEKAPVSCINILFNENGISEYLMAYESITCIAVDGANRKWVGTSTGGLYLLSANGQQQLEHFTTANSPLFNDKILSIGIMPWSGEVLVATADGLQGYRSTATYADDEPQETLYVFPNPVRPDYDGLIAIKGFTRNALVHITDAAGHTVYSTRANGGEAIWDGRTLSGEPVASGVYYVFGSAADGNHRSATKILIIR